MPFESLSAAEIRKLIDEATAPLLQRIADLELMQDEWVNTKTACKILGISDDTLAKIRTQDNPIEWKAEGIRPLYSRRSLAAYNDWRTMRRRPGLGS